MALKRGCWLTAMNYSEKEQIAFGGFASDGSDLSTTVS